MGLLQLFRIGKSAAALVAWIAEKRRKGIRKGCEEKTAEQNAKGEAILIFKER